MLDQRVPALTEVQAGDTTAPAGARSAQGQRWLVLLDDLGLRRLPLVGAGSLLLGRGPECDVRLHGRSVSRRHVRLHIGAEVEVEDLGSANGTEVGGQRLRRSTRRALRPGEAASAGDATLVLMVATANRGPRPPSQDGVEAAEVVLQDPVMRELHQTALRAAPFEVPVLVLGETGSGKEIIAEAVQRASTRWQAPFLRISCAAIAPSLLESELFGHERGAFTGAVVAKPGLFESAEGGTVFLDEVAELPLASQAKLLRVLESRQVTRVGGVRPRDIDVRFIFATNEDLRDSVARGAFRRDLFFRINTITLRIPPLRERPTDILPLARHFLSVARRRLGAPAGRTLSATAEAALLAHSWPGNVRELRNVVQRAALLARGPQLDLADLQLELSPATRPANTVVSREAQPVPPDELDERARIESALAACGGNQRRAAQSLGISLRTLVRRLTRHELPRPRGATGRTR
jgi:two-component system, NtrC family, response regulator AtoC